MDETSDTRNKPKRYRVCQRIQNEKYFNQTHATSLSFGKFGTFGNY